MTRPFRDLAQVTVLLAAVPPLFGLGPRPGSSTAIELMLLGILLALFDISDLLIKGLVKDAQS